HTENLGRLKHRAAEQCKALRIVGKITGGGAVQSFTIKKRRIVNEEKTHSRISGAGQDRTEAITIVKRDGYALNYGALFADAGMPIMRNINADFVSGSG